MSSQVDRSRIQPIYVTWVLLFVAGFSVLQYGIVVLLYYLIFGVPTMSEWVTVQVPMYSSTVLWNDRVWLPVLKVGPAIPMGLATLKSIDPEKGEMNESKLTIPFPTNGFAGQRDRLWVVSPSAVTCIQGDSSTEFKTKRFLNQPTEPFIYQDRLAVIDRGKKGPPTLLVFEDADWVDVGAVVIPSSFTTVTVEGKLQLAPLAISTSAPASLLDLQVVALDGRIHLFLSDGTIVAYREGLELAPVSALAPANVSDTPDLSNLADWQVACRVSPGVGIRSKHRWRGAVVNGQPVVFTISSSGPNPFQPALLSAHRRVNGVWTVVAENSAPAALDLVAVSDDQHTYVAAESLMQTLRFLRLTEKGFTETGVMLKAPEPAFQLPLTRWVRLYQGAFWIGLLFLALGVSRLMAAYRDATYQFGVTTVELASLTRRAIARAIDFLTFLGPGYLIGVMYGLTSEEEVQKNIDKMFDFSSDGLLKRLILFLMSYMAYALFVLIVISWMEGRWGVTLGKWICGIRTLGTTLRPCGFARAMVRELLLIPETLINNTILPATLLIAFTQFRQRIGDLVADTIVIRKPRNRATSESARGDSVSNLSAKALIVFCLANGFHVSAFGADTVWSVQKLNDNKPWDRFVDSPIPIRVEGRIGSSGGGQFRLLHCDAKFTVDSDKIKNLPSKSVVEVRGKFKKKDGGKVEFAVDDFKIASGYVEQFESRASRLTRPTSEQWIELGDWMAERARFYDDEELWKKANEAYSNAIEVEYKSLKSTDAEGRFALVKKIEAYKLSERRRMELVHEGLRIRWRFEQTSDRPNLANWRELVSQIEKQLPGSTSSLKTVPAELKENYEQDPVATYRTADDKSRSELHRLFFVGVMRKLLMQEASSDGRNGDSIADEIDKRIPEEHALAEKQRGQRLTYRLAHVDTATRGEALNLASAYIDRKQIDMARQTLAQWIKAHESRLKGDGLIGLMQLADEYLTLLDDKVKAVELLNEAYKIDPKSEDVKAKLVSLGYEWRGSAWVKSLGNSKEVSAPGAKSPTDISLGMTATELRTLLGQPPSLARAFTARGITEIWTFGVAGGSRLVVRLEQTGRDTEPKVRSSR